MTKFSTSLILKKSIKIIWKKNTKTKNNKKEEDNLGEKKHVKQKKKIKRRGNEKK
jgi:hypothetical protein